MARRFPRSALLVLVATGLLLLGHWRSGAAWQMVLRPTTGSFEGWARVVGDPRPVGAGTAVTLALEGQRFDVVAYGSPGRRLQRRQGGQWVEVTGVRRATDLRTWQHARHIVGRFDVERVGQWWEGPAPARAANRVRNALRAAAERHLPQPDTEVFLGLVIGDDGRQPIAVRDAFRASGLSHLSAVSGQNVAFVVTAASALLRWLRPWVRWTATLAVVAWFVVLTRAEPSVLRAAVMAAIAATAYVRGVEVRPVRAIAATVGVLVLVDPLLLWSIGFWLSVLATLGVTTVAPALRRRLPGPDWVRLPVAVTLGAQATIAAPSLLVFDRLPVVSVVSNLLAVPVAGVVMLVGLPTALLASAFPAAGDLLLAPAGWATRWVRIVAELGARLEPGSGPVAAVCWAAVLIGVAAAMRRGPGRVRH
jgi:competence protein ComEC